MKKLFFILTALTLGLAPAAWAEITLESKVEVEVEVVNDKGEKVITLRDAGVSVVVPGDDVIFSTMYSNKGTDTAENVSITNPIPQGMTYIEGSATGKAAVVIFSVDGKNYMKPEELKIFDEEGKEQTARVSDYTHIRWVITGGIQPGASGTVRFRAKLE